MTRPPRRCVEGFCGSAGDVLQGLLHPRCRQHPVADRAATNRLLSRASRHDYRGRGSVCCTDARTTARASCSPAYRPGSSARADQRVDVAVLHGRQRLRREYVVERACLDEPTAPSSSAGRVHRAEENLQLGCPVPDDQTVPNEPAVPTPDGPAHARRPAILRKRTLLHGTSTSMSELAKLGNRPSSQHPPAEF
jgi:hypothetical protein